MPKAAKRPGLTQALGLAMKIIVALLILVASLGETSGQTRKPVVIGLAGSELDACTSLGITTATANLRAGPGVEYPSIRTVPKGTHIHLCGPLGNGRWESVVLATDGIVDCKVSSPVAAPMTYAGPCESGWISSRLFKVIAG